MSESAAKPQFADYCYRWADHVPVIDAASLTNKEMRAHLRAVSRWAAEVVTFGFDTAGLPPPRLSLSPAGAFTLAQKEACALSGTTTYIFDFDQIPDSEWNIKQIWRVMKEEMERPPHGKISAADIKKAEKGIVQFVCDVCSDAYEPIFGRCAGQDFLLSAPNGESGEEGAGLALHEIAARRWNLISITTKKRSDSTKGLRIDPQFLNPWSFMKGDRWRLKTATHELGHSYFAHKAINTDQSTANEVTAESWGNLLSAWLSPDRSAQIAEATMYRLLWQLTPAGKRGVHHFAQSIAEAACGADISPARLVIEHLPILREAMGWDHSPESKIVGREDVAKASEQLAAALLDHQLPTSYAEKLAALHFAQLWHSHPDLIEQGSSRLKQACAWGDRYWVAIARKGESRMKLRMEQQPALIPPSRPQKMAAAALTEPQPGAGQFSKA